MTTPTPPDLTIGKSQQLARMLRDTPKFRGAVEGIGSFVPLLTGVNTYLIERLNQLERDRIKALFTYLDEAGAELTPEMIASDDYLHRFTITVNAARRTHQREKIRRFARLLVAPFGDGERGVRNVEDYEELLSILEDLSDREFLVLATLERHKQREDDRGQPDNPYVTAKRFWGDFSKNVLTVADIQYDELPSVLVRLTRTGMYDIYRDRADGDGSAIGYLTPRWYRLRELIVDADDNMV